MNKALLLVLPLFSASPTLAAGFDPFAGPKPLAILIQVDPWAMLIGSDTPRVAIYENGRVIYVQPNNAGGTYRSASLSPAEFTRVKQRLQPILALKTLRPSYDLAPGVTDQATARLYLRSGSREVTTQVYGLSEGEDEGGTYTRFGRSAPTPPPSQVFQLHKWLCALNFPKSRPWQPRYVEMMLWDYSYAPHKSLQWPKIWPSLSSPRAIKRGEAYSIFLDGSELSRINKFLARRRERGAVALGGKKWAVERRLTFPNEPLWSRAFARAAAQSKGGV